MNKILLRPERLRQLPPQFSWLDQRLARLRYFERAAPDSWLLYLFLVTVADAQGLSYYAERSLCQRLRLSAAQLVAARDQLRALELIAYRAPVYQVLAIAPSAARGVPAPLYPPPASPPQPAPRPPGRTPARPDPAHVAEHLRALHQALRTGRGTTR